MGRHEPRITPPMGAAQRAYWPLRLQAWESNELNAPNPHDARARRTALRAGVVRACASRARGNDDGAAGLSRLGESAAYRPVDAMAHRLRRYFEFRQNWWRSALLEFPFVDADLHSVDGRSASGDRSFACASRPANSEGTSRAANRRDSPDRPC